MNTSFYAFKNQIYRKATLRNQHLHHFSSHPSYRRYKCKLSNAKIITFQKKKKKRKYALSDQPIQQGCLHYYSHRHFYEDL